MTTRRASCACGQLNVTCEGDPVRISMCHCFSCQQRTGSIFGVQARFPKDQVKIEGQSTQFVRGSDSGGKVMTNFCPTCGSTVFWELEAIPGFVAVAIGAFADPTFPPPNIAVYTERRHPWAVMPQLNIEEIE